MEFRDNGKVIRFGNQGSIFITHDTGNGSIEERLSPNGGYSYVLKCAGSTENRQKGNCATSFKTAARAMALLNTGAEILLVQKDKHGTDTSEAQKILGVLISGIGKVISKTP